MMEVKELILKLLTNNILISVTHKYKHLGYGMCRGAKWTDRKWPIMRGLKTLQQCANSCGRTKGCTAFDITKEESGKFDCMLYGHKHPVPAPGVPGECYTIPGAVYVEEVHQAPEVTTRRPSILDEDEEDYTNIGKDYFGLSQILVN